MRARMGAGDPLAVGEATQRQGSGRASTHLGGGLLRENLPWATSNTRKGASTRPRTHARIGTCAHTRALAVPSRPHARRCASLRTRALKTNKHTRARSCARTCARTRTHSPTHAHARTGTCSHAYARHAARKTPPAAAVGWRASGRGLGGAGRTATRCAAALRATWQAWSAPHGSSS